MKENSLEISKSVEEQQFDNAIAENEQINNNLISEDSFAPEVKAVKRSDFSEKVLSKEFLEDIQKLSKDNRKASAYFQPVINTAREMAGCADDAALSAKMSDLLSKAMSYLTNRGSSMFSSQRNERRATCQRIIDHIGKFLYDAPPTYSIEIYKNVNEKSADSEYEKGFLSEYGYYLEEDHVLAMEAEEKFREDKKKAGEGAKNSPRDVLLSRLDGIRSLMTNKMPPYPGEGASKAEMEKFNEEITSTGLMFSNLYENAILACDQCIQELKPQPAEWAESIKKRLVREQRTFSNNISGYLRGHRPDGTTTWKDALAARAGESINLKGKGVKVMGAGNSIVYRVGEKQGLRRFFKEEEALANDPMDAWNKAVFNAKKLKGYNGQYDRYIERFTEAMKNDMAAITNAKDEESKKKETEKLYDLFIRKVSIGIDKNIIATLGQTKEGRKIAMQSQSLTALSKMGPKTEEGLFFTDLFNDFFKRFNLCQMGKDLAKIDGGKNISGRNVATSRMATLLGIDDMVAKSETVEAKKGDKTISGNAMYEADGVEANGRYKSLMKYSHEAISQIGTMTVFDIICAQVDRNAGNYFLSEKDGKINGLIMIDNDLSFGKVGSEIVKKGQQRLKPITSDVIYTLPEKTKQRIKELGQLDANNLKLFFGDLLDDEEIKFLKERIDTVVEAIDKAEQELEEKKNSEDEDERFTAEMMSDPKFVALYYQNKVYKMVEKKTAHLKEDPQYDYMRQVAFALSTDLKEPAMMQPDKIKAKLNTMKREWRKKKNEVADENDGEMPVVQNEQQNEQEPEFEAKDLYTEFYEEAKEKSRDLLSYLRQDLGIKEENAPEEEPFTDRVKIEYSEFTKSKLEDLMLLSKYVTGETTELSSQEMDRVTQVVDFFVQYNKDMLEVVSGSKKKIDKRYSDLINKYNKKYNIKLTQGDLDILGTYANLYKEAHGNLSVEKLKKESKKKIELVDATKDEDKFIKKDRDNLVKPMEIEGKTYTHAVMELREVKGPLFTKEPSPHDVRQGNIGDCFFISALNAIVEKDPNLVKEMIQDNGDSVTVRFYKPSGDPLFVKVKKTIPTAVFVATDGTKRDHKPYGALFSGSENWVALMEKAYSIARPKIDPREPQDSLARKIAIRGYQYGALSGGSLTDGFLALLGPQYDKKSKEELIEFKRQTFKKNMKTFVLAQTMRDESKAEFVGQLSEEEKNHSDVLWNIKKAKDFFGVEIKDENDELYKFFSDETVFEKMEAFLKKFTSKYFTSTVLTKQLDGLFLVDNLEKAKNLMPDLKIPGYDKEKMMTHYISYLKNYILKSDKLSVTINKDGNYSPEEEALYKKMKDAKAKGQILMTKTVEQTFARKEGEGMSSKERVIFGVVETHAYNIRDVVEEERTVAGKKVKQKFVVIVNPWKDCIRKYDKDGNPYLFASDKSKNRDVAGIFKMELRDFVTTFRSVNFY